MAEQARDVPHLFAVPESGEIPDDAPETLADALRMIGEISLERDQLEAERDGAEKDLRSWRKKYRDLKRDKEAEAKASDLWPVARRVFDYWRERCRHPRSRFGLDRFELIEPFLRAEEYGEDVYEREKICRKAIDGAAFDPFVTERKNGSKKRHDGIDLIFRSTDKFEEFANRAPISDPAP